MGGFFTLSSKQQYFSSKNENFHIIKIALYNLYNLDLIQNILMEYIELLLFIYFCIYLFFEFIIYRFRSCGVILWVFYVF